MLRLSTLLGTILLLLSACSSPGSAPPPAPAPDHTARTFIIGQPSAQATQLASGNKVQLQSVSLQMMADTPLDVTDSQVSVPVDSPDPTLSALATAEAGDHIISAPIPDAPYGMVREVLSKEISGDTVILNTEESSLEQSVQDLEVDESLNIDAQSLQKVEFASGNTYTFAPGEYSASLAAQQQHLGPQATFTIAGFSRSFDESIPCGSESIGFSGGVNANLSAFFNVSIKWFSLKKFEAGVQLSEKAWVKFLAQCKDGFSVEKKLATFTYATRVVWVGPVPIVITPQVELWIGANGQITGKVLFSVEQTFNARYGVGYYKGEGWKAINETTRTFTHTEEANATGTVRGWIGVRGGLWFYGTAFVYAYPKAFLEAQGTISPTAAQFCLYAGWNLSVGARVRIIFWTLGQWETQLAEQKWQLLCKALTDAPPPPPPPSGNQAPVASFTYTVAQLTGTARFTSSSTDADGSIVATHWDFGDGSSADGPQVSHYYDPGDYLVTLTVTDNLGVASTTTRQITVTTSTSTCLLSGGQTGQRAPACP